jgi:hypothetical protein
MIRASRRLCVALIGYLACSTVAFPQKSSNRSGNNDRSCHNAAKILARGKAQQKELWAYSTIALCAGGAAYIATAWQDPPTDSLAMWHLLAGSWRVRDRRIVSALAVTVTKDSLPHAVRFAAMEILLAQYDRVSRIMSGWDPEAGAVGTAADVYMIDGEQPVGAADRQLIASTVLQLSNTDADPWMQSLAKIVAVDMGWRPYRIPRRPPEATDAKLRADCRQAAQTLQQGHPAPKTDWALSVIRLCNESGGPALQALWTAAPTDSVALEQLVDASSCLLDQHVYSGVMAVARDSGAPRVVRLAALRVLAAYVNPNTVIDPDVLARPKPDTMVVPTFVNQDHGLHQYPGITPMPPTWRNDIRDLFTTLWQTDADPIIHRAGRSLRLHFFGSR